MIQVNLFFKASLAKSKWRLFSIYSIGGKIMEKYIITDIGLYGEVKRDWTWASSLDEAIQYFIELYYTSPINRIDKEIRYSKDCSYFYHSVFNGEEWEPLRPFRVMNINCTLNSEWVTFKKVG